MPRDKVSSAVRDVASVGANMNTPRCKNSNAGPGATAKWEFNLIDSVRVAVVNFHVDLFLI